VQEVRPVTLVPALAQAAPESIAPSTAIAAGNALARERDLAAFQESQATGVAGRDTPVANPPTPAPESLPAPPPSVAPSIDGVNVVVYTASWCAVCKRAKRWMDGRGIAYEEHDIEASRDDARAMRALNPRGSIPTFDIEGDVLVGFSEDGLLATMQRAAKRRAARP
jgi:glutaredoxin